MRLYDTYGGFSVSNETAHAFYDKVLASPSLDAYLARFDMEAMIDHQTRFLCKVLGGPDNYSGRALAAAHRHFHITPAAFDEVANLLREVLVEAKVEPANAGAILGVVGSVRGDIVAGAPA